MPVRRHAPECAKTLALGDPQPDREGAVCTCPPEYEDGALSAAEAAALRAENTGLRRQLRREQHEHACAQIELSAQAKRLRAELAKHKAVQREAAQRLRDMTGHENRGPKSLLDYVAEMETEVDRLCDLALAGGEPG